MTAEPQPGRDIEGKQVPRVREAVAARPAITFDDIEDTQVFDNPVALRHVHLQKIAIRPQSAIAHQIQSVRRREDVLARCQRHRRSRGRRPSQRNARRL